MRRLVHCTAVPKTAIAVFDVGEANLRIRQKPYADLVISKHTNPAGWPRGIEQNPTKTALAVFYVGIATPRLNQKHCADLVTLSEAGVE